MLAHGAYFDQYGTQYLLYALTICYLGNYATKMCW